MPYKFSPSSLRILDDCPKCFWLQFNSKIKRPTGIFPSLPSGMDRILKDHYDSFRDQGKLPPELKLEGISLFADAELLDEWRNNFKGIHWTDEHGNLYRGAVDNILQKGEKLIVLDYKTRGFPLKDDTAAHYQNQMDIYNFLLRKNGFETEDYAYLAFYIPRDLNADGMVNFNVDIVKLDIDVLNAERIFKSAVDTLAKKMPGCADDCGYCKWAEELKDV